MSSEKSLLTKKIENDGIESPAPNLDWRIFILPFVAAVAMTVLRRPDAILNPQFWAEGGKVFYADAYNKDLITPLLSPCGGYLDTFPRLIAEFSQFFPLSWAPLLFSTSMIMIRGVLISFMLSSRLSHIMPSPWLRLFMSFIYLALPNSWEVNAGLTHAKIHLALLAFMVLAAKPARSYFWRIFDSGVVLISGLSGPYCIMLTPIAALFWYFRRDRRSFMLFMLTGLSAIIQGTILLTGPGRPQRLLGATPELFFEILSGQVFWGALIGERGLHLLSHPSVLSNLIVTALGVFGIATLINAILRAPLELRLFVLYGMLLFCAALLSPLGNLTDPQWPLMSIPGVGGRYWFIPMLAFISALIWSLRRLSSNLSKALAAAAFAIMAIGIILDWRYPAFKELNFKEHAHRFESAAVGTEVTIPINPEGWSITLLRHD